MRKNHRRKTNHAQKNKIMKNRKTIKLKVIQFFKNHEQKQHRETKLHVKISYCAQCLNTAKTSC